MLLIICEINLILTWSADYIISAETEATKLTIEESGLLIKSVSERTRNETKEQKGGFIGIIFFGTLGPCLLENLLKGKRVRVKIPGKEAVRDF